MLIPLLFFLSIGRLQAVCCPIAPLTVFVSNSTSKSLQDAFAYLQSVRECPIVIVQIQEVTGLLQCGSGTNIDVCNNELFSRKLADCHEDYGLLVNGNRYEIETETRLFVREEAEMQALLTLIQWMNITRMCVFLSENTNPMIDFREILPSIDISEFSITEEIDLETMHSLFRKLVNPQGFTSFLFLVPSTTAALLFQAMSGNGLSGTRLNVLMSRESALYRNDLNLTSPDFIVTGPLFLLDQGCESANIDGDFVLCKLTQVLTNSSVGKRNLTFSVMNMANGQAEVIGSISGKTVNMISNVHYPAAVSNITSALPVITVSMNNGVLNPTGGSVDTSAPLDYLGMSMACIDINQDSSLLPHHQMQLFSLALGLTKFDYNWTSQQLRSVSRANLGVAMLAGEYSGVEIGIYSVFSNNNYSIPQVGAGNTSPVLSSVQNYPLFTRVAMSDAYMSVLYGRMLKRYGWTNVNILYCDDPWSIALYQLLVNETILEGINIANKEEYRKIPADIGTNYTNYLPVYQEMVNNKVRIIVMILFGNDVPTSIEALYDLGLRRGDVVFLAVEWLTTKLLNQKNATLGMKIRELCDGAIQFYPASYIGAVGVQVAQEYSSLYGLQPFFYGCYYYDATLLVAYALDYLIATGGVYDNPSALNKAMRKARFTGCTGLVTIEDGTNDRSPMMYNIQNGQVNETGGYNIKTVGTYDPYGLVLFTFNTPIVWPDHTNVTPLDTRISTIDCPFEAKQIVYFVPGLAVQYTSLLVMSLIFIVITAIIWRKWWNLEAEPLLMKQEISFDDYTLFATIGIEALQYISVGPDFPSWAVVLTQMSSSLSINLNTLVDLKQGVFWLVLDGALGGVCLWLLLLMVRLLKLHTKCKCLCSRLGDLGEKLLPIVGNVCFLPIISMLMNVFQCGQGADYGDGVDFGNTFLQQDCYQTCWSFPHLPYAIASGVAMVIYLPTAAFFRPGWQDEQPTMHVNTAPGYLMAKTIFQVIIIVGNKTLKDINALGHGFAFLGITAFFTGFTFKWRPYGYGRPNLWHSISLIVVLWFTLLTIVNMEIQGPAAYIWIAVFLAGIAVLCIFGVIWQTWKIPAMLYRSKGIEVVDLFRFMFSRGTKYLYLFTNRNRTSAFEGESQRGLNNRSSNQASVYPTFAPQNVVT